MVIDIRPLKVRATKLPQKVAVLILQEPDFIESNDFFAKSEVWFRLLTAEIGEEQK